MKKITTIPAIQGLRYILAPIGRWIIAPHPLLALTIVTSALVHYEILQLFSDSTRAKLIEVVQHPRDGFVLILPLTIITFICAIVTRRLMFHGGAALEQHHDDEIDDRWPQQRIGYIQGLAWFIVGLGRTYLWIANTISKIVKAICVAITEVVHFVFVTMPVVIIDILVATLKFFHSSKSLIATLYTAIAMLTSVWFAVHYPHRLNVVTVFRVFIPIVILVSSWQMYKTLDKLGKNRTERS